MDVLFIGVGEACDSEHGNTSIHFSTARQVHILCDCGFSVPHSYFAGCNDPNQLDLLWISHFHGDHFFGVPLLLLRFLEMRRTKSLVIAGQAGVEDKVVAAMDLAFPRFRAKLCYDLEFHEIEPGNEHRVSGITFQSVQTDHSQRNLGLLVDDGDNKIYYSGDGRPSAEVTDLIRNCDLAVHEAFMLNEEVHHHGSITGCLKLAEKSSVNRLALVHLDRNFRRESASLIHEILDANPSVFLPVEGTRLTL